MNQLISNILKLTQESNGLLKSVGLGAAAGAVGGFGSKALSKLASDYHGDKLKDILDNGKGSNQELGNHITKGIQHAFDALGVDPIEFAKSGGIMGAGVGALAYGGYKGIKALHAFIKDKED